MTETRNLRHGGAQLGALTTDRIHRMARRGEIDHTAEFWSPTLRRWRPLPEFMEDLYPSAERLNQMRQAGVEDVKLLAGVPGEDCSACSAHADKVMPISKAFPLPPPGCACLPWCRMIYVAQVPPGSRAQPRLY